MITREQAGHIVAEILKTGAKLNPDHVVDALVDGWEEIAILSGNLRYAKLRPTHEGSTIASLNGKLLSESNGARVDVIWEFHAAAKRGDREAIQSVEAEREVNARLALLDL